MKMIDPDLIAKWLGLPVAIFGIPSAILSFLNFRQKQRFETGKLKTEFVKSINEGIRSKDGRSVEVNFLALFGSTASAEFIQLLWASRININEFPLYIGAYNKYLILNQNREIVMSNSNPKRLAFIEIILLILTLALAILILIVYISVKNIFVELSALFFLCLLFYSAIKRMNNIDQIAIAFKISGETLDDRNRVERLLKRKIPKVF